MREVGGVGLLPALWRRRTACRRNVLRSRRKMTVSSLPGAVVTKDITGQVSVPSSRGHLHEVILTQRVSKNNICYSVSVPCFSEIRNPTGSKLCQCSHEQA